MKNIKLGGFRNREEIRPSIEMDFLFSGVLSEEIIFKVIIPFQFLVFGSINGLTCIIKSSGLTFVIILSLFLCML